MVEPHTSSQAVSGLAARPVRILLAVAAAALAAFVFATRVYVDFERVRQRVIRTPADVSDQTRFSAEIPDLPILTNQPVALVTEVRNTGRDALTLSIRLDGETVAVSDVAPGQRQRIDASARLTAGRHAVTFEATRPGWTMIGFEVANIHGYSGDPLELVVVPRARAPHGMPIVLAPIVFAGVLALGLWRLPAARWGRWALRALAAISLLLLVATAVAPLLSPFGVLLSRSAFAWLIALLYFRKAAKGTAIVVRESWPTAKGWALAFWRHDVVRRLRHVLVELGKDLLPVAPHIVVVVAMLHGVSSFWSPGVGFTRLILFGEEFAARSVPALQATPHAYQQGESGYDGQFYAQLALDPFIRHQHTIDAMDNAAYRGRRMFFPLVAYIGGLGQPRAVIQAYALLNVVAWLAFACVLLVWLPPRSVRGFAAWAGCLLANGWFASIRASLTDGPSVLLIALSVLALERAHRAASAGVLGLAILGRETSALSAVALVPRRFKDVSLASLATMIAAFVPFALWIAYLRSNGLTDVGVSSNLGAPFAALSDKWLATVTELTQKGWWDSWARVSFVCLLASTVQAVFLAVRWRWSRAWWRIGMAHAVMFVCLGEAVLDGYPGAFTRAMLPLSVAFNIELMQAGRWTFWPVWVLGNLAIITGAELVRIPFLGALI